MQGVGHTVLFSIIHQSRVFKSEMDDGVGVRAMSSSRDVAIGDEEWLDALMGAEIDIYRSVLGQGLINRVNLGGRRAKGSSLGYVDGKFATFIPQRVMRSWPKRIVGSCKSPTSKLKVNL